MTLWERTSPLYFLFIFLNLTLAGFFSRAFSGKKNYFSSFFQHAKVVLLIPGLSFMTSPRTAITVGDHKLSFEFLLPCLWLSQSSLSVIMWCLNTTLSPGWDPCLPTPTLGFSSLPTRTSWVGQTTFSTPVQAERHTSITNVLFTWAHPVQYLEHIYTKEDFFFKKKKNDFSEV